MLYYASNKLYSNQKSFLKIFSVVNLSSESFSLHSLHLFFVNAQQTITFSLVFLHILSFSLSLVVDSWAHVSYLTWGINFVKHPRQTFPTLSIVKWKDILEFLLLSIIFVSYSQAMGLGHHMICLKKSCDKGMFLCTLHFCTVFISWHNIS